MFCGKCGKKVDKNVKFCPNCGEKIEEIKEEKKASKEVNETKGGSNFGWGVLGFFIPIVGFILFLVWLNNKKGASRAAGLGALIGFIKNIIIIFLCYYIAFGSIFGLFGYISQDLEYKNRNNYGYTIDDKDDDKDEDKDDDIDDDKPADIKDDTKSIELTDINTDIKFIAPTFNPQLMKEFYSKDYEFENLKITRNYSQLVIKSSDDDTVLYTIDNVKNAYYYAENDCTTRVKSIVVVTIDKAYYFDTVVHVQANIKPVELKGTYTDYYFVYNHSLTCGGTILTLGKGTDGSYYDLNGEVPIEFKNIYYYDNPDNWIGITRGYKINGITGSAKAVIKSTAIDTVDGIVDVYGYAYKYVYDDGAMPEVSTFTKISNSPVKRIDYSKNKGIVALIFENGEQYQFEYAEVIY